MTNDNSLLLTRYLLLGYRHATRSLSRTSIGVRPLTPDWQSPSMSKTAIAPDVHQPLDVHLDLLSKITFNHALLIDDVSDAVNFFFS